jgi:GH15 family glucan-1,4-alpha-glucosidase
LIRLVRSTTSPLGITHELRAGRFGPEGPVTVTAASTGDSPHHVGGSTFCNLLVDPEEWGAVVIGRPDAVAGEVDVAGLIAAISRAEDRAQQRVDACRVVRTHRDRLETAMVVLDACTDPVTGAVVAAPTTSIPEVAGADRQFDYRYAWLRDASLAAGVAASLGRGDVTSAHVDWLTRRCLSCEGVPVPVVRTNGEAVPDEVEVRGVAGWAGSRPVVVGNAAKDQVQVDGAGLAAEAVWALVRSGAGLARPAYRAIAALADVVADRAIEPSGGIWELRTPVEGTSADLGRWILFDRAWRLSWVHQPWARSRRARWRAAGDEARRRLLGARLASGAVPLVYGEPHADATGLLPVVLGLLDRRCGVAGEIVDGTLEELGIGDPVRGLARYSREVADGFEGDVGGFVPVSWLAVSALAQLDRVEEASALADRLCEVLPALQPEILDGETPLGNLPLVWSHAESARAVYLLRLAQLRRRYGRFGAGAWQVARGLRARRRVGRRVSRAR